MLCELEHSVKELFHQQPRNQREYHTHPLNWQARLEMTQNSFRAKEPLLALRRALLSVNKTYVDIFCLRFSEMIHYSH